MTEFDDLELSVMRHSPLTRDDEENVAALQVIRNEVPPLRQRVATALVDLSYRIDPSVNGSHTHLSNN